jgi:hypothetical protein
MGKKNIVLININKHSTIALKYIISYYKCRPRSTNQVDNKNNESTCLNDESTTATSKNSFLSKLFKRMNSVLSKSPSSAGQSKLDTVQ